MKLEGPRSTVGCRRATRHSPYDLTKSAERIRAATYLLAQDFAAHNILQPPTEEEALEVFTPMA
jgi:hypothetical protein